MSQKNFERALVMWGITKAQELLGTQATGSEFLKAWENTDRSTQLVVLAHINGDLLALTQKELVPMEICMAAVKDEEEEINAELQKALGDKEPREYISLFWLTRVKNPMPVRLRVSWASIGDVTPDEAMAYSTALNRAANVASSFRYNGMTTI